MAVFRKKTCYGNEKSFCAISGKARQDELSVRGKNLAATCRGRLSMLAFNGNAPIRSIVQRCVELFAVGD